MSLRTMSLHDHRPGNQQPPRTPHEGRRHGLGNHHGSFRGHDRATGETRMSDGVGTAKQGNRSWLPMSAIVGMTAIVWLAVATPLLGAPADEGAGFRFEPLAESGEALPPPPDNFPVQLILDDDSVEGSFGIGFPTARQFLWLNQFDRGDAGLFDLEEIWVLFPPGVNVVPGADVDLVVFRDSDGDPTNGADLLATIPATIQVVDGVTFSIYPLAPAVEIPAGGDVLIGVINRFTETGVDSETLPAALDTGPSQGRSWVATWIDDPPSSPDLPPDGDLLPVDGFQPGNWMIRGFGTEVPTIEVPTLGATGLGVLIALLAGAGL